MKILLHPLGIVLKGDPPIIYEDIDQGQCVNRARLEFLLTHMWCPMSPEGADGPAIAVAFD